MPQRVENESFAFVVYVGQPSPKRQGGATDNERSKGQQLWRLMPLLGRVILGTGSRFLPFCGNDRLAI